MLCCIRRRFAFVFALETLFCELIVGRIRLLRFDALGTVSDSESDWFSTPVELLRVIGFAVLFRRLVLAGTVGLFDFPETVKRFSGRLDRDGRNGHATGPVPCMFCFS